MKTYQKTLNYRGHAVTFTVAQNENENGGIDLPGINNITSPKHLHDYLEAMEDKAKARIDAIIETEEKTAAVLEGFGYKEPQK